MCGIAGIINFDRSPVDLHALEGMADALAHRGPDQKGYYLFGARGGKCFDSLSDNPEPLEWGAWLGLAHRRLSIIDLSEGSQPMSTPDGHFTVVFNGEIYNYVELRAELEKLGCKFRTHSDTEVILHAFETWAERCFTRFNGMFSVAIFDREARKVVFARDRLGKKPLFYSHDGHQFIFSSELPSLLRAIDSNDAEIDYSQIHMYLQYQYIHSPQTIYKNIKKLEQGHYAVLDLETFNFQNRGYWSLVPKADTLITFGDAKEKLKELLYDAVRIRLRSDVPYSAFLSGGIDSSMICSIVSELAGNDFTAFTIGYKNRSFDESIFAKEIARKLGIRHQYEILSADFVENIEDIATQFGEPFADSSAIPTYMVSKIAARDYKVAITGDGGDEIFAGYNSYDTIRHGMRGSPPKSFAGIRIPGKVRALLGKAGIFKPEHYKTIHRRAMTLWSSCELKDILLPEFIPEADCCQDEYLSDPPDWLTDCQYCDLKTYLHNDILVKVDRMSMMNSLELRSPLLDYRIVEFAFSLPPEYRYAMSSKGEGGKKHILKEIAADVIGREAVNRPKQGFGFPLHEFVGNKNNPFEKILGEYKQTTEKFFRVDKIAEMMKSGHDMGSATKLWYIYCLVAWHAKH